MMLSDIPLLRCLDCSSDLIHLAGEVLEGTLTNGVLACQSCGRCYPVLRGVGVFFRKEVFPLYFSPQERAEVHHLGFDSYFDWMREVGIGRELKQLQVAHNWEYQWMEFEKYGLKELSENGFFGERAFFEFIPLNKENLRGKTVFIGCGGRGREAYHVAKSHPGRLIVNEIGREIYAVGDILGDPDAALLIRSDMVSLPVKDGVVDVAICDHALQHIPDHDAAFGQLERITRANGRVAVCVYSWENNGIMVRGVEPAKRILHLLPLKALRLLSLLPAAVLQILIHGIYLPLERVAPGLVRKLPLYEHLLFWAKNPFRKIWASCFDLIHAPVSYHFTRDEMLTLAQSRSLTVETLRHTNGTLWSLVGRKLTTH